MAFDQLSNLVWQPCRVGPITYLTLRTGPLSLCRLSYPSHGDGGSLLTLVVHHQIM